MSQNIVDQLMSGCNDLGVAPKNAQALAPSPLQYCALSGLNAAVGAAGILAGPWGGFVRSKGYVDRSDLMSKGLSAHSFTTLPVDVVTNCFGNIGELTTK